MHPIEALWRDVDVSWAFATDRRIPIRVLGASALAIRHAHGRRTKDCDVIDVWPRLGAVQEQLERTAGRGTPLAREHGIYVQVVPNGIPFLPSAPRWHVVESLAALHHFEILALDATDVSVSKLKRFHADDRQDIDDLVSRGIVQHAELVARFRDAAAAAIAYAADIDLTRHVRNLHQVERDMFGVLETEFDDLEG